MTQTERKDSLTRLTSKSREEFIQEYKAYNDTTAKDVCFAIFAELKNAVTSSNIRRLKTLNELLLNISGISNKVQTYCSHSDSVLRNTNLVILACKYNAQESLRYLFKNYGFLEIIHCTPLLRDEDEECHNAIYYAVRLNNVKILQILIEEWPRLNLQEIDEVLSQSYEELKLKNMALSKEMEQFVEDKLINLQFYSYDSANNVKITISDIQERIDLLRENINLIHSEYLDGEIDEKFLYIAKFIAKNIHVLKRLLKSTYNRLPWEEMEFCLVSFIKSCTTQEEINLLYKSLLSRENILLYLCNFSLILNDVKIFIRNVDLFNLRRLPNVQRDYIIETIIQNNPSFIRLYDNYTEIIDVHSLNRIKNYTDLAIAANSDKKEEQFIIIRALQVIGENMKNTLESPKLSNTTSELLLQSLQNDTREIVKNLRNSLSHTHSLYKRAQIEANTDITFFGNIQEDIKKINREITAILYNLKLKRVRSLLKNIIDSSSLKEIREAVDVIKFINYEGMISETNTPENYSEVENLIDELSKKMCNKTNNEIEQFDEIFKIIKFEKSKLEDIKNNYKQGLLLLSDYSRKDFDTENMDKNEIRLLKLSAEKTFEFISSKIESHNFKHIGRLLTMIYVSFKSRIPADDNLTNNAGFTQKNIIIELLLKVIKMVYFEVDGIKWVDELKDKLQEEINYALNETFAGDGQLHEQLKTKLYLLENIFNENSENLNSKKMQAILEMLLLDIMSILGSLKKYLNENLLYLDNNLPLLTGKNLRNHLAHGNAIIDILSSNPVTTIISNTIRLAKDNVVQINRKIGKIVPYNPVKLKGIYNRNLITIINQGKMFKAIANGDFKEAKFHIKNGADIKARTIKLWTALHFAAKQSNLEIVRFLLDQNLSVDTKDMKKQSALHIAAIHGNKGFIEFFIENQKIIIDDADCTGKTLLHLAAQHGHKEVIELLCENKASITIKDLQRKPPWYYAVSNGHTDAAKILLRKEKNVDTNLSLGCQTSLHISSRSGRMEIVNFLLENNANVNGKGENADIALHWAAKNGHINVVRTLISRGSNINSRTESGSTPLHYAVENNQEKVVKILIKKGADINVVDKIFLISALNSAASQGYKGIVEILLKSNADINMRTKNNMSALHLAATNGHVDIVDLLLKTKIDINCRNIEGSTALHLSSCKGHKEVVELLLKQKPNLNSRNKDGHTSLHLAAARGHIEVVKLLVFEGADVNSVDTNGSTPLHFCSDEDTAKFLIEAGANINLRNILTHTPLQSAIAYDSSNVVEILMRAGGATCGNEFLLHSAVYFGSKKVLEMLLNKNFDINGRGENDYTPLHTAINSNQIEVAKILIKKKCDIEARSEANLTPLCHGVKNNMKEIVNFLLLNGADVNVNKGQPLHLAIKFGHKDIAKILFRHEKLNLEFKGVGNSTFLHAAAVYGHKTATEVLLRRGFDINAALTEFSHDTPLFVAAEKNHKDIVEILLANNANVNVTSKDGDTPLHKAVEVGGTEIVNLLLNADAKTNIRGRRKRLPIELAVEFGHLNMVKMLLEYADINTLASDDWTMLHIAAQKDHLEIAKYLVGKGADIHAKDSDGAKPIHIAAREGSQKVLIYLFDEANSLNDYDMTLCNLLHYSAEGGQLEIVKYLIDKKFDINLPDQFGFSALHFAAIGGFKKIVQFLLNNGAIYKSVYFKSKPIGNIIDKEVIKLLDTTHRLYEAVKNNELILVKSCINKGGVVNVKNSDNATMLHQASCKGYETAVDILLKYGANPNILGKGGCTPLHYAANFGYIGIVQKLLSHGAIYDIKSNKNKLPLDLAKHPDTADLLRLVAESFRSVRNGDSKVIDDLNKIKHIDTIKAVMNAHNNENKTLVLVAILNDFPKINKLKEVFQDDDLPTYFATVNKLKLQEKHQEILNIFKIRLEKRKKIFASDNPAILDIQHNIGEVLYNQQKYQEALKLFEEIYVKRQKILGINNKDTLIARRQMGLVLHRLGKEKEALTVFEEISEKQINLLGPNDNDVLQTQGNMAMVLVSIGRRDEALKINYMQYEKLKEIYGIHHPATLACQNNIANILLDQGNLPEALKSYNIVFEARKIIFGLTHSDTLRALHNMVNVLTARRDFDEALKLYDTVYNSQKSALGPWHVDTIITHFNIANVLFEQGNFKATLKIYKELFEQAKTILGTDHPLILNSLNQTEIIKQHFKFDGSAGLKMFEYLKTNIKTAAANGDKDIIEFLLRDGDDVNNTDSEGRTPLHLASTNNHVDIVSLLLQHDANLTCNDNKGNTPLHLAASKGNKEIIKILINHLKKTNKEILINWLDAKNTGGSTALHVAVKGNFKECAKILIKYGATYNLTDNNNQTPSDLTVGKTLRDLFKLINQLFEYAKNGTHNIINKLQVMKRDDYIAITNVRNKQGNTLLQVLMINKHKDVASKLVELLKASN